MLSKSKSKQIHLIKYALLIPMVMGMLMYTSSYASVAEGNLPDAEKVVINKGLTFQERVEKHDKKIVLSKEVPETFFKACNNYEDIEDNHGQTEDDEVLFAVIDEAPKFKGYENLASNSESKNCTSEKKLEFFSDNFNTNIAVKENLKGQQHISAMLKSDRDGKEKLTRVRVPHPALRAEVIRVVASLPDFISGKQRGKAVLVVDNLPIVFVVHVDANENTEPEQLQDKGLVQEVKVSGTVGANQEEEPYAIFPSCETKESTQERKICTTTKIAEFVSKKFDNHLAKELGLTGTQRIMGLFEIGKDGNVTNISAKAPHPRLEKEAIRAIKALPTMIPGKKEGETVAVAYSLPIFSRVDN